MEKLRLSYLGKKTHNYKMKGGRGEKYQNTEGSSHVKNNKKKTLIIT